MWNHNHTVTVVLPVVLMEVFLEKVVKSDLRDRANKHNVRDLVD